MTADPTRPTAAQVTNAVRMPLNGRATSEEAQALVTKIGEKLAEDPKFKRSNAKRRLAVAALVTDLLRVERAGPDKWGSRSMSAGSFTGDHVGFHPFKAVKEAAATVGLVSTLPGWNKRETGGFGPAGTNRHGAVTRLKATDHLVALAALEGVTPDNVYDHFDLGGVGVVVPLKSDDLLILKAEKTTINGRRIDSGTVEIFASDAEANQIRERVRLANDELMRHNIEGMTFSGLRRIYNDGDREGFRWQWGGRHYGSHTNMPPADRLAAIKIDDEQVVEIDIRASHLTILYGLTKTAFDRSQDPYFIDDVERDVVKSWLTRTLGAGKFHKGWSSQQSKDFIDSHQGQRLGEVYPIAQVRIAMLEKHPVLKKLDEFDHLTLLLQNIEADIIAKALDVLRQRKVATLPVHDSLIAPISKVRLVAETLALSFTGAVGIVPHLRISQDGKETYSAPSEWLDHLESM